MKSTAAIIAFAGLVAGQSGYQNTTSGPVVNLGYASYLGASNASEGLSWVSLADTSIASFTHASNSVTSFLGIYYAQAPVGDLRWQPPMDIENHNDYDAANPIDATVEGPICVQGTPTWAEANETVFTPPTGNEDCLLLDVLVPNSPVSSSLPVMVQIHGGGECSVANPADKKRILTSCQVTR